MNEDKNTHVVVLGASPKPHRYSHQAILMLQQHGFQVSPVHPRADTIAGLQVLPTLTAVQSPVHTLTLYVSPAHLEAQIAEVLALAPQRVIFNPGSESPLAQQRLTEASIHWVEDCTLVMLRGGNF